MNNTITYARDTHKKEHKVALHYPCHGEIVRFAVKNNAREIKFLTRHGYVTGCRTKNVDNSLIKVGT